MSLSNIKVLIQLKGTLSKIMTDGSVPSLNYVEGLFQNIPSDANLLYTNGHTIASSGTVSLDLSGSLIDAVGNSCVFSKVYAVLVINTAVLTGKNLEVGGDTASFPFLHAAAQAAKLGPSGCFFLASMLDGYAVTATTADILLISNVGGGASITAAVAVLGKS